MTENEWLACTDPQAMLEFLRASGKLSDRKARLFSVAVCRRIWTQLTDEKHRKVVEVVERLADGEATVDELDTAWAACRGSLGAAFRVARATAWAATRTSGVKSVARAAVRAEEVAWVTGEKSQCNLLHDFFGPMPFRPVALDQPLLEWNDSLVVRLAHSAYEDRFLPPGHLDLARLAVLSDALEEAGCDNADILGHLHHSEGTHVRGCWVVDLLLGNQ